MVQIVASRRTILGGADKRDNFFVPKCCDQINAIADFSRWTPEMSRPSWICNPVESADLVEFPCNAPDHLRQKINNL